MQTNYVTLIIGFIAAVNTAALAFGLYHLDDAQLEAIDKLVSVGFTLYGVFASHKKLLPPVTEQPQQSENAPD